PTFGYLIGFRFGAYLAGYLVEKMNADSFRAYFIASLSNIIVVYIFGVVYYYFLANYYLNSPIAASVLLLHGLILCIPGDLLICIWSAMLMKRLRPVLFKGESLYVDK
ncbi:biotin transporter BioY, partial [Selenomonadales bacterium OttesenSCG-928-I06]|nr:biotin transporter BioY [Selenomonadales bacterium OttesenSCG-928-I06]